MESVRTPAVAGTFYPAGESNLRASLSGYLANRPSSGRDAKAIIVPHAGYVYSGPVAASAYARLLPLAERIRRVVLLGPAHRVGFGGLAIPTDTYFATPLGRIPIDQAGLDAIADLPFVIRVDAPHAQEHSLEVQLPFLQVVLNEFELVPMVVGDADPEQVAEVLERLWGGPETLIVISTDLSHYLDYKAARAVDADTTQAIERLRESEIGFDQACGALPVRGLLLAARGHGLTPETVDLRNSGDTAGPRDHVVGYGAYVFC